MQIPVAINRPTAGDHHRGMLVGVVLGHRGHNLDVTETVGRTDFGQEVDVATKGEETVEIAVDNCLLLLVGHTPLVEVGILVGFEPLAVVGVHERHCELVEVIPQTSLVGIKDDRAGNVEVGLFDSHWISSVSCRPCCCACAVWQTVYTIVDNPGGPLVIDCHGHYTTTPPSVGEWRKAQTAEVEADPLHVGEKGVINVSDDQIRESLEGAQLKFQRERGTDLTIFSPRASWMGHHLGNEYTSLFWTEHQNELIRRCCDLFPENFAPVCQLPQSPGVAIDSSVHELRRCVQEMGFIGCNVNPDPSGGLWNGPPLWNRYWWPLWEAMQELDVPGMIHVSTSCNEHFFTTGSHYLGADTTAFVQALTSGFMSSFPGLRWVIPHGGGAVPYHCGRFKGLAQDKGWDFDGLMDHIWFDTCVYHQPGIDLLVDVVPMENVLFASEMVGAVRGIDPDTGNYFDDTKVYIDAANITDADRAAIYESNIRRVYPRLGA